MHHEVIERFPTDFTNVRKAPRGTCRRDTRHVEEKETTVAERFTGIAATMAIGMESKNLNV